MGNQFNKNTHPKTTTKTTIREGTTNSKSLQEIDLQ